MVALVSFPLMAGVGWGERRQLKRSQFKFSVQVDTLILILDRNSFLNMDASSTYEIFRVIETKCAVSPRP